MHVLLFALMCMLTSIQAAIYTGNDISALKFAIEQMNNDALVVLDVDDTLIYPRDMALRSSVRPYFQKILLTSLNSPMYPAAYLNNQIMLQMTYNLVDPASVPVVQELQAKKIPVIALTASYGGTLWGEMSNAEIRVNQLKSVGHSFVSAFPDVGHFEFTSLEGAAFKDGVLFSSQHPKGQVLMQFLKTINWMPKGIIFVDDRLDFIQSVEAACEQENIPSISIHYTAANNLPVAIDWNQVVEQAEYLAKTGTWKSDAEINSNL